MKGRNFGKLLGIFLLGMLVSLTGCGSDRDQTGGSVDTLAARESTDQSEEAELLTGKHHVEIVIEGKGSIFVELDADSAPITTTNFIRLAGEGFYDGLTFHRIMEGFMMQGGDPEGTGTGGSDETILGEFAENGVDNPLSHTRGAISMARSQKYNSASSQFFIVQQDSTYLDGSYACFGYVTEGMDIVDDICENTTGQDSNGMVPLENRPVMETIKVID